MVPAPLCRTLKHTSFLVQAGGRLFHSVRVAATCSCIAVTTIVAVRTQSVTCEELLPHGNSLRTAHVAVNEQVRVPRSPICTEASLVPMDASVAPAS